MIVYKDNETLYPATFQFNCARVLTTLAAIVKNNGGRVKPLHTAILYNRTPREAARETETRLKAIQAVQDHTPTEKRQQYINDLTEKLNHYRSYHNKPFTATHTSYITFVLDGIYYYMQYDSNFLFPHSYNKTPIVNGKYSRDSVTDELKEIVFDPMLSMDCSDNDINEIAQILFDKLVALPCCPVQRDSTRHRVRNTYNNGYHYETVYSPERFDNIDF